MSESRESENKFYKNSMIAVCDLLGVKRFLYSHPLKEIVEDDFGHIRKIIFSSLSEKETPNHIPTLEESI